MEYEVEMGSIFGAGICNGNGVGYVTWSTTAVYP